MARMNGKVTFDRGADGPRWQAVASNGKQVGESGEAFSDVRSAEEGALAALRVLLLGATSSVAFDAGRTDLVTHFLKIAAVRELMRCSDGGEIQ